MTSQSSSHGDSFQVVRHVSYEEQEVLLIEQKMLTELAPDVDRAFKSTMLGGENPLYTRGVGVAGVCSYPKIVNDCVQEWAKTNPFKALAMIKWMKEEDVCPIFNTEATALCQIVVNKTDFDNWCKVQQRWKRSDRSFTIGPCRASGRVFHRAAVHNFKTGFPCRSLSGFSDRMNENVLMIDWCGKCAMLTQDEDGHFWNRADTVYISSYTGTHRGNKSIVYHTKKNCCSLERVQEGNLIEVELAACCEQMPRFTYQAVNTPYGGGKVAWDGPCFRRMKEIRGRWIEYGGKPRWFGPSEIEELMKVASHFEATHWVYYTDYSYAGWLERDRQRRRALFGDDE